MTVRGIPRTLPKLLRRATRQASSDIAIPLLKCPVSRLKRKLDMKMLSHTCKAKLHSGKGTKSCPSSPQSPIVLLLLQVARVTFVKRHLAHINLKRTAKHVLDSCFSPRPERSMDRDTADIFPTYRIPLILTQKVPSLEHIPHQDAWSTGMPCLISIPRQPHASREREVTCKS